MTGINHHIPDNLLDQWHAGTLPEPFAVVVAAHLSICSTCRARMESIDMLGGIVLDREAGTPMSGEAKSRMMAALDLPSPKPAPAPSGIFPSAVMTALGGGPPRWRMLGGGIRQQILMADETGSLRLLYIPPGRAVPEHGHQGLELTLVLQGSFSDSGGAFHRGDVETAQEDVDHQPVAGEGDPCICLAATDAPLRFTSMLPRLLQPIFRI